jgi:hypothetical protein
MRQWVRLVLVIALAFTALAAASCAEDPVGGEPDGDVEGDTVPDAGLDAASDVASDSDVTPDAGTDGGDAENTDADAGSDVSDAAPDADVVADLVVEVGPPVPEDPRVYGFVRGCYSVSVNSEDAGIRYLAAVRDGEGFAFTASDANAAARFYFQASDLATYLLYDEGAHYLVADDAGALGREAEFMSDILLVQDGYLPGAQWVLEGSIADPERFQMRHLASGRYLTTTGADAGVWRAAPITLTEAAGCAGHPELTLDAIGAVEVTTHEDGSVFGFAEPHTHLLTNFGFGGGGVFHGAPFHPLGVQHALPSCERFHGPDGRADLLGIGFAESANFESLIELLTVGLSPTPDHATDGYPTFTDWPNGPDSATHQTQYYLWLQRAYLGGLRLLVQHATSHEVLCQLVVGTEAQPVRYSCNDMVAIDRQIAETRRLER